MGLFARLHRVTVGRIERFLEQVEDPEVVLPQLIREMQEQLHAAVEAEAEAAANLKHAERELKRHEDKARTYGRGARTALGQGDEDTAREALDAQIQAEAAAEAVGANVAVARQAKDRATLARERIQAELDDLRAKKDEILTRVRVARAREQIQRTVSGGAASAESILDAVARMEAKVDAREAELEIEAGANDKGSSRPGLERRLAQMDRQLELDKRMAVLRQEVSGAADVTEQPES